jgi:CheY-like chemotaxis protein
MIVAGSGGKAKGLLPTVLCVDDEVLFLEGIRRLLERHGYRVLTARNGREALELFESGQADSCKVLVTDISMPEMSGEELIAWARERHPELGIVIMSGEITEEKGREWQALGIREVLRKPVPITRLEQAILNVSG